MISRWHGFLDYDRKIPAAKRERTAKQRGKAKVNRLHADAVKTAARMAAEDEKRRKWQEADAAERARLAASVPSVAPTYGKCPGCGGPLARAEKSPDSGMGCLIIIIGLVLSPVLIGIPLIFVGIHYMSKKQAYWSCHRCRV